MRDIKMIYYFYYSYVEVLSLELEGIKLCSIHKETIIKLQKEYIENKNIEQVSEVFEEALITVKNNTK